MDQTQTLDQFYASLGRDGFVEGHSQQVPEQTQFLRDLVAKPNVLNVMEIGFNAGHSAETFLEANKAARLYSFDIGIYPYVYQGKKFLDTKYPNRHFLILGDSRKTLPTFAREYDLKFDLIFIDGGHTYDIAKSDILNSRRLAHQNTVVAMDDVVQREEWRDHYNHEPTQAWNEAVNWEVIQQRDSFDYDFGRGMAWGTLGGT